MDFRRFAAQRPGIVALIGAAFGAILVGGTGGLVHAAATTDSAIGSTGGLTVELTDPDEAEQDASTGQNATAEVERVLLLGDSVTQGAAGDATWRYRLAQHLDVSAAAYDFVGPRTDVLDLTTGQAGSQAYRYPDFDRDHAAYWAEPLSVVGPAVPELVGDYEPDILVELVGINDLRSGADPTTVLTDVRRLVADARSQQRSIDVVLVELPQTWIAGVTEFNAGLRTIAADLDTAAAAVEVAQITDFERTDTWDDLHPNVNGEIRIAAAVADALAELGLGEPYDLPHTDEPVGPVDAVELTSLAWAADGLHAEWTRPDGATAFEITVTDLRSRSVTTLQVTEPAALLTPDPRSWIRVSVRPLRGHDAGADATLATGEVAPRPLSEAAPDAAGSAGSATAAPTP